MRAVNAAGAAGAERLSSWPTAYRATVVYGTAVASLAGVAGCFVLGHRLDVRGDPVSLPDRTGLRELLCGVGSSAL